MKILPCFLAAVFLLLPACSNNPEKVPTRPNVTAAPKQESAKGSLNQAREYGSEADKKNTEARAKLIEAKTGLRNYQDRVASLQELVRKLQENGAAGLADLQKLYDELDKQAAMILNLVTSLELVENDLQEERMLRVKASGELAEATAKVAAKEAEADQLRQQLVDAGKTIDAFEVNARNNHQAAMDARGAADRIEGEKRLIIKILIAVSALAALSIVANYLQLKGIL